MNNKALTLSLIMSVLAVLFVQSYVNSIEEEARKKHGTEVLAVVAKRDIKEMEMISENMLELKEIPKRYLEPSAISQDKKESNHENQTNNQTIKNLAGMIAIVPIRKYEQLSYNKVADPSIRTGLSPQITPGRRAIAIPVSEFSGVAKLIKPGDRIDLIAVIDTGGGKENKISKTILQDVAVLSIGRYITNNVARVVEVDPSGGKEKTRSLAEDFSFSSVTLEVEPAQAQLLALIMNSGENSYVLTLRNNDDLEKINIPSIMIGDIIGVDASRLKNSGGAARH